MTQPITEKALNFAIQAHEGQKDDSGLPYIFHPIQVANIVQMVAGDDPNLIASAYLHDVIEDCGVTHEELVKEFNQDVADLVMEVTHEGEKDLYGYYFPHLHSERGVILKFADRLSNLSRMGCWSDSRRAHYLRRSRFWKESPL